MNFQVSPPSLCQYVKAAVTAAAAPTVAASQEFQWSQLQQSSNCHS